MRKHHSIAAISARAITVVFAAALLSNCSASGEDQDAIRDKPGPAFSAIGADETIYFTGTEPFWGGETSGEKLRYTTPEDPDGTQFSVKRFNGNNGMSVSGELDGAPFRMAITPGACSDGMSETSYPYVVTLRMGEETRFGCAWTDRQPRSGGAGY